MAQALKTLFAALLAARARAQADPSSGAAADCTCFTEAWPNGEPTAGCRAFFDAACTSGSVPAQLSTALCGPAPAIGDLNAVMARIVAMIMLIEPLSVTCGAPYLTLATFMDVTVQHPVGWDAAKTSCWVSLRRASTPNLSSLC